MTKMRIAPGDRPRVKLECLRMLATLKLDKARATLIGAFMTNYLELTSGETAVYNKMLKTVEPKVREVVMQLTNEWIEEGVQKGLRRGRQEGRRDLILRQLRRRVGAIPAKLARQVDRLDDAAMIALGDALLDFTSPADAQRWLAQRNK
jgi:predicted transposase YdaD